MGFLIAANATRVGSKYDVSYGSIQYIWFVLFTTDYDLSWQGICMHRSRLTEDLHSEFVKQKLGEIFDSLNR